VLIAKLTSVRRAPRAFFNIKSPLALGAIALPLLIISSMATIGILYTGLATGALSIVVWVGVTVSLLTIIYPGALMGLMKAIPFWRGSGPSILLLSAALVSGCAVVTLAGGLDKLNFSLSRVTLWGLVIYGLLLSVYVVRGRQSSKTAQISVQQPIKGNLFFMFIIGVIALGLVTPLALYIMDIISSSTPLLHLGSSLILIGGILMRYSLLAAGVRMPMLSNDSITAAYWLYP
jgi:formate-dependent nitrite reductase membrane component NrfD